MSTHSDKKSSTLGSQTHEPKYLLAVTGASGMIFVRSFLQVVAPLKIILHGICSPCGKQVLEHELGIRPDDLPGISQWFDPSDMAAGPASGSSSYSGMVILPCTMGSLAAIASGLSLNLIHRAADVMLKERRPLILSVRETPLNRTHLKNMLTAHDAGAIICPPLPSFYLQPSTLDEAVLTYTWRLADQMGISLPKRTRWEDHQCLKK